ncbi:hypothetical protein Q4489_16745 [Thalassotalea sp. 1_MG-2023]|uniref:hypothetical protein n=1 Tax=Thalassotalea sp. 1_MG-2023 TaxID=3062680 RepID=UPI0026E18180|nr:hypothetical protein [Thalassotalea sp. 1_MG-2023]MDO6428661.1 hypothetical protein [Thalassotalea sp. 1_MG-2023]
MDYMSVTVGFLVGTATGAAGTYFGNKYTDIRKSKEKKRAEESFYKKLWSEHPTLLSEMKADLTNSESSYHREFFALSKRSMVNIKGQHLSYYFEEHDSLEQQLIAFVGKGLIVDVTEFGKNLSKYQFTDTFVDHLKSVN